jgi:hypothetical protein
MVDRLTANAEVATVLASIPASSDTVESEMRQMRHCGIQYCTSQKIPLFKKHFISDFYSSKFLSA